MPWIKYDGLDSDTYPKQTGNYRIKRSGVEEKYTAHFKVGFGWFHLIQMPDYYWLDDVVSCVECGYPVDSEQCQDFHEHL